jgi:ubiquinone/menaquinone biosynthesis C-methylase UbiE
MVTDERPAQIGRWLRPGYDRLAVLMGVPEVYWQLVAQAGIPPDATVLEIGCGTGNVILRAARSVPTATMIGLDPDAESLAIARRKAGPTLRLDEGDATALPYADGSIDRVLSSLMWHHLSADQQLAAVREARRVLAPGGSLHLVDLDTDPRVAGPMATVHRLLSLLPGHGAAHSGHGDGHGHGHGHGAARPIVETLAEGGFRAPSVVTHGRARLGAVTFYRAG